MSSLKRFEFLMKELQRHYSNIKDAEDNIREIEEELEFMENTGHIDIVEEVTEEVDTIKTATVEILEEGEKIFGSPTKGEYFVREYKDGEEMGGAFFLTMEEAEAHVKEYQSE